VNSVFGREVEWPSGGMQANARSIAKLNNLLAHDGGGGTTGLPSLLSARGAAELVADPTVEYDTFFKGHTAFSKGGVSRMADLRGNIMPKDSQSLYEGMWGWGGRGGSMSLWDPDRKLSLAYTMNGLTLQAIGGPRSDRILAAVQKVLKVVR
jgi:CubicO group peptidase (beta-lactamase class C family)